MTALRPDTSLVTITIGGNDVNYIGGLMASSCTSKSQADPAVSRICQGLARYAADATGVRDRATAAPDDDSWRTLQASLERITEEVRRRSPNARVIFVDYVTVVPEGPPCAAVPLSQEAAAAARATANRLAAITEAAARRGGAEVLKMSELSRKHDACSSEPWATGLLPPADPKVRFSPYHPTLAGMAATADALEDMIAR